MNLLIVEDDARVARMLERGLAAEGFAPTPVPCGSDALAHIERFDFNLILLDVRLPDIDGFELCRRIRADGHDVPVLMLTAREQVDDRVAGLNAGADDYLTKPFAFEELLARINALSRRTRGTTDNRLQFSGLCLDPGTREASLDGEPLDLSAREFALLQCLMRGAPNVLSRARLLERVWGTGAEVTENTIDVYIGYLRRKLRRRAGEPRIQTVRGMGYRLTT
ncbi:transcriptional regulator [Salinisphaera orenii YIM 95161]|uniref:Transcriptional regulator n=2 Tax=Salinisphaera TaxID=180541 RepID=A0A423Q3R4_9GAMM|nr:transcriptional regulator [Salinisphaera halophila YIM 95161]